MLACDIIPACIYVSWPKTSMQSFIPQVMIYAQNVIIVDPGNRKWSTCVLHPRNEPWKGYRSCVLKDRNLIR